jgi:hypothetical protein
MIHSSDQSDMHSTDITYCSQYAERRASHQRLKDGDVGQSEVTLGSELRKERPAVGDGPGSLAGLRAMMAVADSLVEYQNQRGHRVLDDPTGRTRSPTGRSRGRPGLR